MLYLWTHYIVIEGEVQAPKKVVTYYFSFLCKPCFDFKRNPPFSKETIIVYQPVLMDDHDVSLQIFVFSLIKKFRWTQFWDIGERFYQLEQSPKFTKEDIVKTLGFTEEEVAWMQQNPEYQKEIEDNLRCPVQAKIVNGCLHYMVLKDDDIDFVPMMKEG